MMFLYAMKRTGGLIFMIRTGSAEFNIKWLKRLDKRYQVRDGRLWRGYGLVENEFNIIDVPEEQVLFGILGIDFIEPKDRI